MAESKLAPCGTCNKNLIKSGKQIINCSGKCEGYFHLLCVSKENGKRVEIRPESGEKWSCKKCMKKRLRDEEVSPNKDAQKKNKNDTIMIGSESENEENLQEIVFDEKASIAEHFRLLLEAMKRQSNSQKSEIKKLTAAVNQKQNEMQEEINENSENIVDLRIENAELRKQVSTLECDVNVIKQQRLANTVEISGVLQQKEEQLPKVICMISNAVKVQMKQDDISNVYRKRNGKIIATFREHQTANDLITASFKHKIDNSTIGLNASTSNNNNSKIQNAKSGASLKDKKIPIFINNALTPMNQWLYKRLRDLKKDKKIEKISFRNSCFAIKIKDDGRFVPIYNENQLNQLSPTNLC